MKVYIVHSENVGISYLFGNKYYSFYIKLYLCLNTPWHELRLMQQNETVYSFILL